MLLPISDAPNPRGTPVATILLVAVNVGIFLFVNLPLGVQPADPTDPAMAEYIELLSGLVNSRAELEQATRQLSAYDLFVFKHGFRPSSPSLVDLVTSMFLHGGLMHLFGNMLFLWIYGDNVEARLNPLGFLFWYLLTGAAATLFHAAFFVSSGIPLVGASGAISGVLGFYFVWFPKNTVRVLFFLPPIFWHVFEVSARVVLGFFLVIDNLLPFVFAGAGGVAHGAHIGGFLAGGAAAFVMSRRTTERGARAIGSTPRPAGDRSAVRAAIGGGRIEEAASEYFQLPSAAARESLSGAEAVDLAHRLRQAGHTSAAIALLQRTIQLAPRGADMAELHAALGQVFLEDRGDLTAAFQHLAVAQRLGPSAATSAMIRRSLAAIESRQRFHPGRVRRRGR